MSRPSSGSHVYLIYLTPPTPTDVYLIYLALVPVEAPHAWLAPLADTDT